jgi:hypothetical protein
MGSRLCSLHEGDEERRRWFTLPFPGPARPMPRQRRQHDGSDRFAHRQNYAKRGRVQGGLAPDFEVAIRKIAQSFGPRVGRAHPPRDCRFADARRRDEPVGPSRRAVDIWIAGRDPVCRDRGECRIARYGAGGMF